MEELEASDKIFVYKFGTTLSEEEILPLHMALNRYGEATLLWVVLAERDRPAGTVEVVMPGLLKGVYRPLRTRCECARPIIRWLAARLHQCLRDGSAATARQAGPAGKPTLTLTRKWRGIRDGAFPPDRSAV